MRCKVVDVLIYKFVNKAKSIDILNLWNDFLNSFYVWVEELTRNETNKTGRKKNHATETQIYNCNNINPGANEETSFNIVS